MIQNVARGEMVKLYQCPVELERPPLEVQIRNSARVPRLVTADVGFYSPAQEEAVQEDGVKWIAVLNRSTTSVERKKLERSRWFGKAQHWRTGWEGRISILDGMKRWVGFGVLADNLIKTGTLWR